MKVSTFEDVSCDCLHWVVGWFCLSEGSRPPLYIGWTSSLSSCA